MESSQSPSQTPSPQARLVIERWSTEIPLTIIAGFFAAMLWLLFFISIIGAVYGFIIGLVLFLAHIIFIAHIRGNGIKLGPQQFPELYESVERFSTRIGLAKTPDVYLIQAGGALNALATKIFRSNMIILFSDLLEACGTNTAARDMIVGHELGHLHAGHLRWHWFFAPAFIIPFLGQALSRAREYTCDRYGMAAVHNKEGGLRGLAILAAGAEKGPQVNLQAFTQQKRDLNTGWMTIGEWLSSHPPLAKRILVLEPQLSTGIPANQRGVLRALGIIGSVYFLPLFAFLGAAALMPAVFKQKLFGGEVPAPTLDSPLPPIDPTDTALQPLIDFLDEEQYSEVGLPKDQNDLKERWKKQNASLSFPLETIQPRTRYELLNYQGSYYVIRKAGADGVFETEDDKFLYGDD